MEERLEELEKLEKLHKKALAKKVEGYHRSTRTTLKFFEPIHFFFRDRLKWYYRWHAHKFATIFHWLVLFLAISGLIYSFYLYRVAVKNKNAIPQRMVSITGQTTGSDKVASLEEKSNIAVDKSRLTLEDKKITIGVIRKKVDLEEMVSWKNISWSAEVPEGTSIVYRMKISNEDKPEAWEDVTWSNYFRITDGSENKTIGIPIFKSIYMKIEVAFEGDQGKSPTLNYLRFGYTPFHENKIVAFLRDKLLSGLAKIFRFLEKREGIQ